MSTLTDRATRLRAAWDEFERTLDGLDVATLETEPAIGTWPVRDAVAHLIDWGYELLAAAEHARGGPAPTGHPIVDDDYNVHAVTRHADDDWPMLHAMLRDVFSRAERLLDERADTPASYPWGGDATIGALVDAISEHQEEHNAQLASWRAGR